MRLNSLSLLLAMLMAFCVGSLSAQSLYSEDFENETPFNSNDLCATGNEYAPADANWALGPACAVPTNGTPKLVERFGTTYLEYNRKYPADSEVFSSDTVDVSGRDAIRIQFNILSEGGLEAQGSALDQFNMYAVLDGTPQLIYTKNGHVGTVTGSGNSAYAADTLDATIAMNGASSLFLRLELKISDGGNNKESYMIDDLSMCVDNNQNGVCDCDDALAFSESLNDTIVQCLENLPTECDASVTANRGEVACGLLEERLQQSSYNTSVPDGTGSDWVLILYGESTGDEDDHQYVPTGNGVSFTTYENGTIAVSGQVVDVDDPSAILNIQTIFDSETAGTNWPGLFKAANDCGINSMGDATTDAWSIYLLNSGLSYLTGEGSLDGTLVQLSHMPETNPGIGVPNFGFQVGVGGNNRSCGLGAGGWFYYNGTFDGETISNGTGDFAFDLTEDFDTLDPCDMEGESNVTLVYTAIDLECGDVLTVEQNWLRSDSTKPTFDNAPADITISCENPLPAVPAVTASDNCTDAGFPTVTFVSIEATGDTIPGACPNSFQVTRQWVATDCSGNTAAHTQTITVQDVTKPTITGGMPYTAECDGNGNEQEYQTFLNTRGGASASDNCSADANITWTNNSATAPVFEGCFGDGRTGEPMTTATESQLVTFTATDECGNSESITLLWIIEDTTAPELTATAVVSVACEAYSETAIYEATASDACGSSYVELVSVTQGSGSCAGTYTHKYKAIDACNNESAEFIQTVNLVDETAPTIDVEADDLTVECDGQGNTQALSDWLADHGGAEASDLCSDVTWSYSPDPATISDACGETGSVTVTFTAKDDCMNPSTTTATFTIEDTTDPAITAAADTTAECDGMGNSPEFLAWLANYGGATGTDACSDLLWTNDYGSYQPAAAGFTASYGPESWTLVEVGNQAELTFSDDGSEMHIQGPVDQQFGLGGGVGLVKACQPARRLLSVSFDWEYSLQTVWPNTGSLADPAFYINDEVHTLDGWNATFFGNGTQNGSMTITVETGDEFGWGIAGLPVGGLGGAELTISNFSTQVLASQDPCQDEQRIVTFKAEDDCGNYSLTTASFYIEDTTAPSIDVAAADSTAECGSGNPAQLQAWLDNNGGASASDICGNVTWSHDYEVGDLSDGCGNTGAVEVTFTATDDCGNFSTTSATFTIVDTTAPAWPNSFYYDYAACEAVLDPTDPTQSPIAAVEDCGNVTYSIVAYQMSGGCPNTWMRVWTATDECGNVSEEAEQYLELYDNIKPVPVISCPEDIDLTSDAQCAADTATTNTGVATGEASDNCDSDVAFTITYSDEVTAGECAGSYTIARTWSMTAEDDCDNDSTITCVQTISVTDELVPTITMAAQDSTVECDGMGNEADVAAWLANHGGATASDNCSDNLTWTNSGTAFNNCTPYGGITVTFRATDECDNYSETTATFTIEDNTAPVISGEPTATIACDAWSCDADALEEAGLFSVTEDCGDYTLSMTCQEQSAGCVTPTAAYYITVTATDDCSNVSTEFNQIVTLQDTVKPVLTVNAAAPYTTTLDADCMAATDTATAGVPEYEVEDNCDNDVDVVITYEDGAQTAVCGSSYSFTRTFTLVATDHCMNRDTVTSTQLITANDEMAPSITCPADATVECDGNGNASDLTTFLAGATATDNCDTDVTITHDYMDGDLSDDCGATGSVTVTFTATDDCDNVDTCSATFTIVDTTAPSIDMAAANDTTECDGAGNAADLEAWLANNGGAMASDDCSDVTWYNNYDCALEAGDFLTYNQGSLGNANSVAGSDYLDANFASVFPAGVKVGCSDGYELTFTSAEAVDTYLPCTGGAQDLVLTHGGTNPTEAAVDPTCWDNAFVSHLLTAKINVAFDAADAAYSASDFPATGLIRTSGALSGFTLGEIIALSDEVLGGCSSEFTPNQLRKALRDYNQNFDNGVNLGRFQLPGCDNSVTLSDDCGATGAVTVTFTAVDECGNSSSTSAMFTIEDTTGPDFTGSSAEYTIACDAYSATTQYEVQAADDCSDVTITIDSNADVSGDGCAGTIYRVYKAVDACGNETTFGQTIDLTDDVDPVVNITCPADYSAFANASCDNDLAPATTGSATYTATDNCDNSLTEVLNYTDGERTYTCAGEEEGSFTFVRTWKIKATDHCGNEAEMTCAQNITITDNSAPTGLAITCPDDATVYSDASCGVDTSTTAAGMATALATDNCDSTPTYNITYTDGASTYSCDQSEVCGVELYSEDFENEDPTNADNLCHDATPYVPADNNWSLGPACMILTNGIPQLVDDAGDNFLLWNNRYSAGDTVFNSAPIDISGLSNVRVAFQARSQGDLESSGQYLDQFEMFVVVDGVKTSIFQADGHVDGTSGGGNSAVITLDYEDNVAVSGSSMYLSVEVKISGGGGEEQYGIDDLSICTVDVAAEGSYSFVRTWTATASDNCGNTSSAVTCDQTITVLDTIAPVLSCANMTVECDGAGNADDLAAFLAGVTATDNCDSDVIITNDFTALSDSCGATGAATVTFTATDDCGNMGTCTATFTIEDTTAPDVPTYTLQALPKQVYLDASCAADTTTAVTGVSEASSSDACDSAPEVSVIYIDLPLTYTCTGDDDTVEGSYSFQRKWTASATDACGNTSAGIDLFQTITVTDTIKPSITCPGSITVECDGAGNTDALNTFLAGATATDNCDSDVAITHDYVAGSITGGCSAFTGSVTVTFTATDDCGNSQTCSSTFTIADTTPPSITADEEVSISCEDYDPTVAYEYAASDACSGVITTIEDTEQSGACAGEYSRTYTATDSCGLSTTFIQIVKLTDTEAPTFDIACPADTTLYTDALCAVDTTQGNLGSATHSNVDDNCDNEVSMAITSADVVTPGCTGSYTIVRTWTITGTDHCSLTTTKSCSQTITVTDNTAPTITAPAVDSEVECDGSGNSAALETWLGNNAGATATDACSAVTWTNDYNDGDLSDECGETGSVMVVFTATDACGNFTTTSATFTIVDETNPALSVTWPEDASLTQNATCTTATDTSATGSATATATDACSNNNVDVVISSEDSAPVSSCTGDDDMVEGSYSFTRTWTVTATDLCDNETTETHVQNIVVTDNTAPQFTETCEIMNDPNGDNPIVVCCEDDAGTVTIPAACTVQAEDNCDSDVSITYSEMYVGDFAPTATVASFCASSTPEAYADGLSCNFKDPHSFVLFGLEGENVYFTSVGNGTVAQNVDGTWTLTQTLTNAENTGGMDISVTYGEAYSWTEWMNQEFPTGYKRDCGVLVDDHENWDYRIMESGSAEGTGIYSGYSLTLAHAPANNYYAMQIGLGANNQNDNYGYSAWFMATGTMNTGTDGEQAVFFSGDLFGDLDCCLPWSIDRDYVAVDDCGNENTFSYSISVNDEECGDDDGPLVSGTQEGDHTPVILGGAGDVLTGKTPIRVTNLQPNPTNDLSLLGFSVTQNMRLRVDMYTMDGLLVTELFDGIASPNVNHTLDIEADNLESGMYQIRLSSSQYLVVKKLLVTE